MLTKQTNKTIFMLLSISIISMSAFGATATTPTGDPFLVTIPHLQPSFEFNAAVVWLKPGASNLNYVIFNKELPTISPHWTEQELQPSYRPGFEIGLRYFFPCYGRDARINWTHLSNNANDTTAAPSASFFLGPDWEIGPFALPVRNAHGDVRFDYDVVNLDVGQYVSFGPDLRMRFFGGLSAAWLGEHVTSTYTGDLPEPFPGPFSSTQQVNSTFDGIGPRAGMSAEWMATTTIGVIGEAGMSALIGNMNSRTNYNSSSPILLSLGQTNNYQTIKDQNVMQVIPGFDAKLGVNYRHLVTNCLLLTIALGYQAAVYVNAISQYVPASVVVPFELGGIFVDTMSHTLSNYSVHGPFLNFTLSI